MKKFVPNISSKVLRDLYSYNFTEMKTGFLSWKTKKGKKMAHNFIAIIMNASATIGTAITSIVEIKDLKNCKI